MERLQWLRNTDSIELGAITKSQENVPRSDEESSFHSTFSRTQTDGDMPEKANHLVKTSVCSICASCDCKHDQRLMRNDILAATGRADILQGNSVASWEQVGNGDISNIVANGDSTDSRDSPITLLSICPSLEWNGFQSS